MHRRNFLKSTVALGGLLVGGRSGLAMGLFPALPAPQGRPQPPAQNSATGAGQFIDITDASGVRFIGKASHTSKKYLPETMGSGVALFDYDNDGRLDIFFVNGAPLSDPTPPGTIPKKTGPEYWNRLYHQRPNGTFEDVTEKAGLQGVGYDMGVAIGDYDNDGYQDVYVTGYGGNRLYHNNGDGTFTDVTEPSGTGGGGWSTSAVWVDLDNDGLLDLVVLRYLKWDFSDIWCGERRPGYRAYCHPDLFPPIMPLVYHNEGNSRFREIAAKIGMKPGKGLGASVADYDRDGHIDVFAANDSMTEFLYHNTGNGTFADDGLLAEVAVDGMGNTYAGMGTDFQDYNNDGLPDLIVTNLANQKYALYQNNGDGTFSYASYRSGIGGVSLLHSGWGVCFLDYDNDGFKDLIVAQGHVIDNIHLQFPDLHYREPMLLMHNIGGGKFIEVSPESGKIFHQHWAGRGLARGDIDNDGRLDVVVTTNDGPAYVVRNVTPTYNHWITLLLVGRKSNRDAIGAVIKLTTFGGSQWWTVSTGGSYCSSSDKRAHFGLGTDSEAALIEIQWPSGIRQVLHDVKGDQVLRIDEPVET
ncbi:MAG TPA: CRTAC1 family protein [Acidobacteriaceae bacterium]|nr:CRTAC1 family protein [Acidobacteriaceae bacterium]